MNTTTLKNSAPSQGWMHKTGGMIPGLLLAGAIAAVATWAAQFPAIVVARLLGFPTAPMLESTRSDEERAAPKVQF